MYRRMRSCLFGFFEQAERHQLYSEIVLVEWNPPPNKPLLKDAYQWPEHSKFCTIRVIVVPPSIHQKYDGWQRTPIHNDVAQNVAIRRSDGEFVLSTNIDVLFSEELVYFLAQQQLQEKGLYGINCYFVKSPVVRAKTLEDQLSYCMKSITGAYLFKSDEPYPGIHGIPGLHTGQANFHLASRRLWHLVRGYPELDHAALGTDTILSYMFYLAGAEHRFLPEPMRIYHMEHASRKASLETNFLTRTGLRYMFSQELLSLLRKWVRKFIPYESEIARRGIPERSFGELQAILSDLLSKRRSFIFNGDGWGLGEEKLEEYLVTKANLVSQFEV